MGDVDRNELSPAGKLVLVVLDNCGPLSPSEVAEEAYLAPDRAHAGLIELERVGAVEPVCGVWDAREDIYALVDGPRPSEPSI